MPQTNDAEWLNKAAAAALLGVAPRTLERHEARGFIEKRTAPRGPLDRGNEVEYSRADILALKAGKPNVHARAVPVPDDAEGESSPTLSGKPLFDLALVKPTAVATRRDSHDPFAALAAHLAALSAAYPKPEPVGKPWLTMAEAVEYSGLPPHYLLERARAGQLRAVNVGTGAREFWRFNREALAK